MVSGCNYRQLRAGGRDAIPTELSNSLKEKKKPQTTKNQNFPRVISRCYYLLLMKQLIMASYQRQSESLTLILMEKKQEKCYSQAKKGEYCLRSQDICNKTEN